MLELFNFDPLMVAYILGVITGAASMTIFRYLRM